MRVKCLHGFFIFDETREAQVGDFMSKTGLELAPWEGAYTFADLAAVPDYTLAGSLMLGAPTIKTFAGRPWDLFEQNLLVYDFTVGLVLPIAAVVLPTSIRQAGQYFVVAGGGLLLPGSITDEGKKVQSFQGWYSMERRTWRYSGVTYV